MILALALVTIGCAGDDEPALEWDLSNGNDASARRLPRRHHRVPTLGHRPPAQPPRRPQLRGPRRRLRRTQRRPDPHDRSPAPQGPHGRRLRDGPTAGRRLGPRPREPRRWHDRRVEQREAGQEDLPDTFGAEPPPAPSPSAAEQGPRVGGVGRSTASTTTEPASPPSRFFWLGEESGDTRPDPEPAEARVVDRGAMTDITGSPPGCAFRKGPSPCPTAASCSSRSPAAR